MDVSGTEPVPRRESTLTLGKAPKPYFGVDVGASYLVASFLTGISSWMQVIPFKRSESSFSVPCCLNGHAVPELTFFERTDKPERFSRSKFSVLARQYQPSLLDNIPICVKHEPPPTPFPCFRCCHAIAASRRRTWYHLFDVDAPLLLFCGRECLQRLSFLVFSSYFSRVHRLCRARR